MSIYKRGKTYFYNFWFNGKHIQATTKQGNPRVARQMEAAHRTALAKGEVGIRDRKSITLAEFLQTEFLPFVEAKFGSSKARTLRYYHYGVQTIQALEFASLDISEISDQHAAQYAARRSNLSPSTINCGLRTLRRALYLAYQWGKLNRMPKITLATGERQRERVLSAKEITTYLTACPQPWKDCAILMLGTGLRPSEVFSLSWEDIVLTQDGGTLRVRAGKSRSSRRMLPLVPLVFDVISARHRDQKFPNQGWLFPLGANLGILRAEAPKTSIPRPSNR